MTPSRTSLEAWCDATITLMLDLARTEARPAALALARALSASLSTLEATDWMRLLQSLEAWEASANLPPTTPRPAGLLRRILEAQA